MSCLNDKRVMLKRRSGGLAKANKETFYGGAASCGAIGSSPKVISTSSEKANRPLTALKRVERKIRNHLELKRNEFSSSSSSEDSNSYSSFSNTGIPKKIHRYQDSENSLSDSDEPLSSRGIPNLPTGFFYDGFKNSEDAERYQQLLMEKAECLIQLGRLKEALSVYSSCDKAPPADQLSSFIEAFTKISTRQQRRNSNALSEDGYSNTKRKDSFKRGCGISHGEGVDSTSVTKVNKKPVSNADVETLGCTACLGVLVEPWTLPCGHSYCKKCIEQDLARSSKLHGGSAGTGAGWSACRKCGLKFAFRNSQAIKVNVLVNKLVTKFWSGELKSAEFRTLGNNAVKVGNLAKGIENYTSAIEHCPNDHLAYGNRSHAYLRSGDAAAAVADAEEAIRIKPDWAKGHFRKATALRKADRLEEAFKAYYECLALEDSGPTAKAIRAELTAVLSELLKANQDGSSSSSTPQRSNSLPTLIQGSASSASLKRQLEESFVNDKSKGHTTDLGRLFEQTLDSARALTTLKSEIQNSPAKNCDTLTPINVERDVDASDFECGLCLRLMYQPVTTPCGHTFCRVCIYRCLDHAAVCPMCKGSLAVYLAERREAVTEFVDELIQRYLKTEYEERRATHEREMDELSNSQPAEGESQEVKEIPVFVCTSAFPGINCPLHVFEPRYRLMMRRCMETGTREFGMAGYVDGETFADIGTMLEIRDIRYFPDGRAVVDTVGGRRFRVKSRGMRDGYHTAMVEFIKDDKVTEDCVEDVKSAHNETYALTRQWLESAAPQLKEGIAKHYGQIPEPEPDFWSRPNGPTWIWWILTVLPLEQKSQLKILSMTNLKKRCEAIQLSLRLIDPRHMMR